MSSTLSKNFQKPKASQFPNFAEIELNTQIEVNLQPLRQIDEFAIIQRKVVLLIYFLANCSISAEDISLRYRFPLARRRRSALLRGGAPPEGGLWVDPT